MRKATMKAKHWQNRVQGASPLAGVWGQRSHFNQAAHSQSFRLAKLFARLAFLCAK
jgi:hypothetical protein